MIREVWGRSSELFGVPEEGSENNLVYRNTTEVQKRRSSEEYRRSTRVQEEVKQSTAISRLQAIQSPASATVGRVDTSEGLGVRCVEGSQRIWKEVARGGARQPRTKLAVAGHSFAGKTLPRRLDQPRQSLAKRSRTCVQELPECSRAEVPKSGANSGGPEVQRWRSWSGGGTRSGLDITVHETIPKVTKVYS
ncbi:hypothetical protein B0H14DRAFT_2654772 [Mycena olivaceomarginata]|nr:hypothetical protein B0H14DRAFT_2654772 [Mycena olivaceomarginata]